MQFVSASVTEQDVTGNVIEELIASLADKLQGRSIDLMVVFFSPHYALVAVDFQARLRGRFQPQVCIGCAAAGVISETHEYEYAPAIAVLCAILPDVQMTGFALPYADWPDALANESFIQNGLDVVEPPKLFILLADPLSTPMEDVLGVFERCYPGVPIVGGMATATQPNGEQALLLDGEVHTRGVVGLALGGALAVDVVVSQGCRPFGMPYIVSAAQRNLIMSLEDRSPMLCLQEAMASLPRIDPERIQNGLHVGRVVQQLGEFAQPGDFIIRGVMGVHQESDVIAIGDYVQVGDVIQFHLRDAEIAAAELDMLLVPQQFAPPPAGALLFTCVGRGQNLYEEPDKDLSIVQAALGHVPLIGFFALSALGPVGDHAYLHAQTLVAVIFRQLADEL